MVKKIGSQGPHPTSAPKGKTAADASAKSVRRLNRLPVATTRATDQQAKALSRRTIRDITQEVTGG